MKRILVPLVVILSLALAAETAYIVSRHHEQKKGGDLMQMADKEVKYIADVMRHKASPHIFTFDPVFDLLADQDSLWEHMFRRRKSMNQMMQRHVAGAEAGDLLRKSDNAVYVPDLDIKEEGGKYMLHVDLPGMEKDKVHIDVRNYVLTIQGERTQETEESTDKADGQYYRMERSYGSFLRSVPLPADADSGNIQASMDKGVLTITIPKTKGESGNKPIDVPVQ